MRTNLLLCRFQFRQDPFGNLRVYKGVAAPIEKYAFANDNLISEMCPVEAPPVHFPIILKRCTIDVDGSLSYGIRDALVMFPIMKNMNIKKNMLFHLSALRLRAG